MVKVESMVNIYKEISILYVEDDKSVREGYIKAIRSYCNELFVATNGIEGLEKYNKYQPDIIISDINVPKLNGLEMVKQIKAQNPNQPVIFTTAYSDSKYTIEALELQVEGYLLKPVDKLKLKQKIEQISKAIYLEKENKKQQLIIDYVVNNSSSIIFMSDFESISFATASFFELQGIENLEQFSTKYNNILEIFIAHEDYLYAKEKEEFLKLYENAQDDKKIVSVIDSHFNPKAFILHLEKIEFENKTQYIFNLSDISKIQAQKKVFEHKAYFDGLTGIANREKFEEVYKTEASRYKRYGNSFSMAIMDIDFFKRFNDNFGHLIGDEMLISITQTINNNIRNLDFFARWGGEEFVLLMPQTKLKDAIKVCNHLREKVANIKHEIAGSVTVSFGVSEVKENDTLTTHFERCDDALYQAKENGRNRVESN